MARIWLNMDGMLHVHDDDLVVVSAPRMGDAARQSGGADVCQCGRFMPVRCRRCGGLLHRQPVYAGIAESCPVCDRADWSEGDAPAHDSVGIIE